MNTGSIPVRVFDPYRRRGVAFPQAVFSLNIRIFTVLVLTCVALFSGCSSIELPDDRASLLKLGDSTDLETSVLASQKLAELYGQPALIEALNTSGPTGRSWAAALLLGYPSSATRDALFAAAKDPSPDVRVQVAIALGGICDAQCLPALDALARDSHDRVRRFAAQSKSRVESQTK
jgi:HEAT repeat protein